MNRRTSLWLIASGGLVGLGGLVGIIKGYHSCQQNEEIAESEQSIPTGETEQSTLTGIIESEPYLSEDYLNYQQPIKRDLAIASKRNYDLTKTYPDYSDEGRLQERLWTGTELLYMLVCHRIRYHIRYHSRFQEEGVKSEVCDSLFVLQDVEQAFGIHPAHQDLVEYQKRIVQLASVHKLPLPSEFQKYAPQEQGALPFIPSEYRKS